LEAFSLCKKKNAVHCLVWKSTQGIGGATAWAREKKTKIGRKLFLFVGQERQSTAFHPEVSLFHAELGLVIVSNARAGTSGCSTSVNL